MKNSKKKTMRFYLTAAGIKVLIKVLQLCGRNATHVPGRKAINICRIFWIRLINQVYHWYYRYQRQDNRFKSDCGCDAG